jgi:hypothetical protein
MPHRVRDTRGIALHDWRASVKPASAARLIPDPFDERVPLQNGKESRGGKFR